MRKWFPAVLIGATVVFSLAFYNRLPDPMPVHWNAAGEIDGYGSRAFATFLLPVVMLFIWGLLLVLPKVDPRSANIERFRDAYDILVIAVVAVMAALQVGIVGSSLGWPVSIARIVPVAIGGLFLMLGVLLPRFQSNFFVGIRTPWTLSSEMVWKQTHRVGGYIMILFGVFLALAGVAGTARWLYVMIGGSVAMVVVILGYSYVLWRREQRSS